MDRVPVICEQMIKTKVRFTCRRVVNQAYDFVDDERC